MYPLGEVLFVMLTAIICGATSYSRIEMFARSRSEWLKKYLKLENGMPVITGYLYKQTPILRCIKSRFPNLKWESAFCVGNK